MTSQKMCARGAPEERRKEDGDGDFSFVDSWASQVRGLACVRGPNENYTVMERQTLPQGGQTCKEPAFPAHH